MRDENVSQQGQVQSRIDQLKGDAVAGIDHVRNALINEQISRRAGRVTSDERAAARPEQYDAVGTGISRGLLRNHRFEAQAKDTNCKTGFDKKAPARER